MKKQMCQSCAMPLEKASDFGTEKDGSASKEYCHFCYQNGEWVNPEMTIQDAVKQGHQAIDGMQANPVKKWFMKKGCEMMIPKLKRWA